MPQFHADFRECELQRLNRISAIHVQRADGFPLDCYLVWANPVIRRYIFVARRRRDMQGPSDSDDGFAYWTVARFAIFELSFGDAIENDGGCRHGVVWFHFFERFHGT